MGCLKVEGIHAPRVGPKAVPCGHDLWGREPVVARQVIKSN